MFKIKVGLPDFVALEAAMLEESGRDITQAMSEATEFLQHELRDQMIAAGLGRRLANTWRRRVYPQRGTSLNPAGYVWSKAPKIVDAFDNRKTIRPVNGNDYMWLPTKNVPKKRGRKPMTPNEVDSFYDAEFVIRPSRKRGVLLALIPVVRGRNGRSWRTASRGRLQQGRAAQLIHMFTLVKETKMPNLLDLQAAGDAAGAWFVRRVSE